MIRGLTGAMFDRKSGGAWTNPYVTDGLVAMWDGEWNEEGGKPQNPSAMIWKDISGNRIDLEVRNTTYPDRWGNKCCISNTGWKNTTYDFVKFVNDRSVTVEVCASFRREQNSTTFINFGTGRNFRTYGGYVAPTRYNLYWWVLGGANNNISAFSPVAGDFTTLSFSVGQSNEFYRDGLLRITASYHNVQADTPLLEGLYGDSFNTHCVRIYSRALTADEIASNYAVDAARFNLA